MARAESLVTHGIKVMLDVGDVVWCLIDEPAGKERRLLVGTARCRVLSCSPIPTVQKVEEISLEILAANPSYLVGRFISKKRAGLYLATDPDEHLAFRDECSRFWAPLNRKD